MAGIPFIPACPWCNSLRYSSHSFSCPSRSPSAMHSAICFCSQRHQCSTNAKGVGRGNFCGVLIGDEYNSSKGKTEQRRWALAVVEGTECFMPLGAISEIPGSAEGPRRMSRDECVAACKRAAQGRKPSSLHTMMQSAKHRKSLGDIDVQFTPGVRGGLRTRRNTIVVPSPAAAPSPADTCFGDSSAAAETAPSGVVLGVPASGIPLRLLGWGETKLMKQTVAALQLSLAENQISASAAESRSKASLIRLLLKRYASM